MIPEKLPVPRQGFTHLGPSLSVRQFARPESTLFALNKAQWVQRCRVKNLSQAQTSCDHMWPHALYQSLPCWKVHASDVSVTTSWPVGASAKLSVIAGIWEPAESAIEAQRWNFGTIKYDQFRINLGRSCSMCNQCVLLCPYVSCALCVFTVNPHTSRGSRKLLK